MMTKKTAEEFAVELKTLADRLNRCEQITRYDTAIEKQAWTLAHTFLDLSESFRTFLEEQLPRLRDEHLSCQELHAVLLEVGEEFRHILYHMHDAAFYAYLRNDVPAATSDKPQ